MNISKQVLQKITKEAQDKQKLIKLAQVEVEKVEAEREHQLNIETALEQIPKLIELAAKDGNSFVNCYFKGKIKKEIQENFSEIIKKINEEFTPQEPEEADCLYVPSHCIAPSCWITKVVFSWGIK